MNSITQKSENETITSMEVAEMVGKDHAHLMRDIQRYAEQLGESKIGLSDFFTESTYHSDRGKTLPCYLVTEKGCEFIAHKLTGTKGTAFTAKYINRFHEMKDALENKPMSAMDLIRLQNKALVEVDEKVESVANDLEDFKHDVPLFAVECDTVSHEVKAKGVEILGGKSAPAYQDSSLRGKLYSDIHRELDRQFDVVSFKAIKRRQLEQAVAIVRGYEVPIALKEAIDGENSQLFF